MAYEGPEYWYVIYKAIGDFGGLMRDAAEAKQALQGMQDAVKAETAAEVAGATQAAAARAKDTQSIQQQAQALSQLGNTAKQTNVQLLYGGRNDQQQHLTDMAQELQYTTLLNRQKWLGFSSVQQAMSYRQQMYQLALLENRAHFAGYLTADQYLGFLQREVAQTAALSAAIRERTSAVSTETQTLLAHANALQGTHQTAGSLGEQLAAVTGFSQALSGIPPVVRTRVLLDASQALSTLAAYRTALGGVPRAESTDIVSVATRLGGVPLAPQREPLAIEAVPQVTNLDALRLPPQREAVPVTVTPRVAGPAEPLRLAGGLAGAGGGAAASAEALSAASDETGALGEAMAVLNDRAAVSGDVISRFAESMALAAVDARALAQGLSRVEAVQQLLAENAGQAGGVRAGRGRRALTEGERTGNLADYYGLQDVAGALQAQSISSAPHGYPVPAPGMQLVSPGQAQGGEEDLWAGLSQYMQPRTATERVSVEGGSQAEQVLDKIAVQMEWLDKKDAHPRVERDQLEAALDDAYHLDGVLIGLTYERAEPEVELKGGAEAVTEADLLAAEMAYLNERSRAHLGVDFSEVEAARMAAEGLDEELHALPHEIDTVIEVDSAGAAREVRDYSADISMIEREVGTRADFEDTEAESGLSQYLGALIAAVQHRYEFYASFNDDTAKEELSRWVGELEAARAEENRVTAGMGGASGGGGGGGPPPGGGDHYSPDPDDDGLWRELAGAIDSADQRLRDFERDSADRHGFAPSPDEVNAWDQLGNAERDAGLRAADSVRQLQEMAQAAAAAGKAADAAKYAWAAATLQAAALKAQGTAAADDVAQLADLAASATKVGDSSKAAYAAQQLLASGFQGIDDPAARAAAALDLTSESAQRGGGWWGLLNRQVTLWSGLMGDTHLIGQVQLWHILLDGIVEVLALWVPALLTAGAGLAGFAAAGYQAGKEVYQQWQSLTTVGQALNTTIPPLTDNFQKLQNAVRPQVYQLLGDYLDLAGGKAGAFTKLILQTGDYLDRFAARIVVDLQSGGNGLANFFAAGEKDLVLIGQGFSSLGIIIAKFIQATAITHVAEDLATVGDFILRIVADIASITPAPVLAAVLGLHAFVLWGGLAASAAGKVVIGIAALAGRFTALNDAALAVARGLNATNDQLVGIAKNSAAVGAVSDAMGLRATETEVAQLGVAVQNTGQSLEQFVTAAGPSSAARLEQFAGGLNGAGRETVALGIAAGATDGELAGLSARLSGVAVDGEEAAGAIGGGGGFMAALGRLAPVLGNAYVDLGLLAAALAGVYVWLGTRADQTKKFTDAIGAAVQKASLLTVVGTTVSNLAEVTTTLNTAQQTGVGNASELAASQADLSGKLQEELTHVGDVSKAYGTDFVGSLNLLNAAGVTTSQLFTDQGKTWAIALQQVKALVDGYRAMGQQMGAIGNDLNVLNLQNSQQVTSMGKLNSAYDAWTKTVSGAPTAFITLAQGFARFSTDAKAAGAAMTGLSAPSLTLQNDFQSNYSNVEQFFDAFRNDQALTGQGNFTQFVKDAVASLLPMAGGSKEAAAQISALAQEAGGPATTSIKTLQQWVGSIKDPLLAMYQASNQAAIGASGLSQDAARLTHTLQSLLAPAMAQAVFNAHGGQKVFNDFADSLAKSGPSSLATVNAAHNVAAELLAVSGSSANAKSQFIGFAEAMGLGAKQANALWTQVTQIPNKKTIDLQLSGIAVTKSEIAKLQGELPGVTGVKKLQIQAEIKQEQLKLYEQNVQLAKDKTSDLNNVSLSKLRGQLAQTATSTANLVKPGETDTILKSFKDGTFYEVTFLAWIPRVQRALNVFNHDVGQFFSKDIPKAAQASGHAIEAAWNGTINWFTKSVPHGFDVAWKATTSGLTKAWNATWSGAVTPVAHAVNDVKHFVASNFDNWWKTHGESVKQIWATAWGQIRADALSAWHFIESDATTAWRIVTSIVGSGAAKQVWSGFSGAASAAWGLIVSTARASWTEIAALGKAAWALVSGAAKAAWDFIWSLVGATAKSAADIAVAAFKVLWDQTVALAKIAWDAIVLVINEVIDVFTGHWATAWKDLQSFGIQVWNAVRTAGEQTWNALSTVAVQIWNAIWGALKTGGDQAWNALKTGGSQAWNAIWGALKSTLIDPLTGFFTGTVPQLWNGLVSFGARAWSSVWSGFVNYVLNPIEQFFTVTLPNAITGGISNALNALAGPVDSILGRVRSALSFIPGLAAGGPVGMAAGGWVRMAAGSAAPAIRMSSGSVPGTGDEDGTRIIAMGGEFMLRKPARMALQAAYGPQFLEWLNHADVWLGAGSHGNQASQKRFTAPALSGVATIFSGGLAAGGVVPGLVVPGLSANLSRQLSAATAGQLPRELSPAAGRQAGLRVEQLTINNPVAEKPSESITRASNRLAFLGGRGVI